ncbi:MAG TPA: prepilin peptidase [Clostridiales bacterium]|jgi:prepilin signal peptidase PulO-like enzyme (type II secretory pathway)|nr:prepilin peptidase [Clostridiales bacterium]
MTWILWIAFALPAGAASAILCLTVFNRLPPAWLTDYGEQPDEQLWQVRLDKKKYLPGLGFYFAGVCFRLLMLPPLYALPAWCAIFCLTILALADIKYLILPDQFIVFLLLTAIGFLPWLKTFWFLPAGIAAAGGALLVIGGIGRLIYRRDILGFGDIKLACAIGALAGPAAGVLIICFALLGNGALAAVGLISRRLQPGDESPLGPWLAVVAVVFLLFRSWFE